MNPKTENTLYIVASAGFDAAGYGLCISARDMAKIGQLCLDGGMCAGKCIVSAEWLAESTQPRLRCGEEFGGKHTAPSPVRRGVRRYALRIPVVDSG